MGNIQKGGDAPQDAGRNPDEEDDDGGDIATPPEDSGSVSSADDIFGDAGTSSSEEDDVEEINPAGGDGAVLDPPGRLGRQNSRTSLGSGLSRASQAVVARTPAIFTTSSSIISFINLLAVAYILDGNMSGVASLFTFIAGVVGVHAFNTQILPRIRVHVRRNPALQTFFGPLIGAGRRNGLLVQLRGSTEVNVAATTLNLLMSSFATAAAMRILDVGALTSVGSFALSYFAINNLMRLVARYIDNGSPELRDRILHVLAAMGSNVRERVGLVAILRWVRDSISPSRYPIPANIGEAVRRQELQERGAEIVSAVIGACVFFGNLSGSGVPWAVIFGGLGWAGVRLPVFAYMGLMRMAQSSDIREEFRNLARPYSDRELARALVLRGSAMPTVIGDGLAMVGVVGGRILGIGKWLPLLAIARLLPASGQKLLLGVIGANVAASTVDLAYAVGGIIANEPPEDVINYVHDNSPVTKIKRTAFFEFWIFFIYFIVVVTMVTTFRKYEVLTSDRSFDALYATIAIVGIMVMIISTILVYSGIDNLAHKFERNCLTKAILQSPCFRGWWGYTGGSEGQTPQEIAANAEGGDRVDAIVEAEQRAGNRDAMRRRATFYTADNTRRIRLQDGSYMVLNLIRAEVDIVRYTVAEPPQDPAGLHITEVQISTSQINNFAIRMSDGRVINRRGGKVLITSDTGRVLYDSDAQGAHGAQVGLADLQNLVGVLPPGMNMWQGPVRDPAAFNPIPDVVIEEEDDDDDDDVPDLVPIDEDDEDSDGADAVVCLGNGQGHVVIEVDLDNPLLRAEAELRAANVADDDETTEEEDDEATPLLQHQHDHVPVHIDPRFSINAEGFDGDDESFLLATFSDDDVDQGGSGGSIVNSGHKEVKISASFPMSSYFQDNTPDTLDLFQSPYTPYFELEDNEIDLFNIDEEDDDISEEMAEMRITIEPEIKEKDVYDYETDGPIKPKRTDRKRSIDEFLDEDEFKTGPIYPKIYDHFDPMDDPTKGSRLGDPDECKYEIFGYCTDNISNQLLGAFLLAPMMVASSK